MNHIRVHGVQLRLDGHNVVSCGEFCICLCKEMFAGPDSRGPPVHSSFCPHRVLRGYEATAPHPFIMNASKGAAQPFAYAGGQPPLRPPVAWSVPLREEGLVPQWGAGARVLWVALCTLFFVLARPTKAFAETCWRIHPAHCLLRVEAVFFCDSI